MIALSNSDDDKDDTIRDDYENLDQAFAANQLW